MYKVSINLQKKVWSIKEPIDQKIEAEVDEVTIEKFLEKDAGTTGTSGVVQVKKIPSQADEIPAACVRKSKKCLHIQ